jgi:hypothetical protein
VVNIVNAVVVGDSYQVFAAPSTVSAVMVEFFATPTRASQLSMLAFYRMAQQGYIALNGSFDPGDGGGARHFETDVTWINTTNFIWFNPFPAVVFTQLHINIFGGGVAKVMAVS